MRKLVKFVDTIMAPRIPTSKKYQGKYVATATFNECKVLSSGKDPAQVRQKAIDKGIKSPVVVYVPKSTMTYIF